MSTTHYSTESQNQKIHPDTPRSAQCLRHHVWMAACVDCRDARALPHQRVSSSR